MVYETAIAMCQRHVAEGRARIARHEAMIIRLSKGKPTQMTQRAVESLANMKGIQRGCEDRLAFEVAKLQPNSS